MLRKFIDVFLRDIYVGTVLLVWQYYICPSMRRDIHHTFAKGTSLCIVLSPWLPILLL